ncbi:HicA family toxin-antitoxin system [Sporosarcina sp. BI001-red]|uniref:HicA family toxin-antitoxin system n=1 Tax=Sporosarcina sp. BI001-red TaxID=2282866 RepID=UPI000E28667D|nr:HicA family toxin-antitoxin system [Sporosarcina sp. BI001-red]REB06103.1 HicA family toxin-antitoxin system [Sporosarcina sp. BI001-red]
MVDDFEVETIYDNRIYERNQFSFSLDGKEYKGDYLEGEIHWLNPHPKQDLDEEQLLWVESEVFRLLDDNKVDPVDEELDEFEVTPMFNQQVHKALQFKLLIDGEEYKGLLRQGKLEWFHPKPRRKVNNAKVEKIEKQVQQKIKSHLDETN